MSVTRYWMVTINNPTIEVEELFALSKATWLIGQKEKGESGTPHFQLLLWFRKPVRMSALKKAMPTGHFEAAKDPAASEKYVTKESTRVEGPYQLGERPIKRNDKEDWQSVWDMAASGDIENIPAKIRVQHYSNLKKIERDYIKITNGEKVRGIWLWGTPGIGKSHLARIGLGGDSCYPKPSKHWWCGYQGERIVVLEDVDHSTIAEYSSLLKIWADCYGFKAEVKGGSVAPKYKWFVVTSNYSLHDLTKDYDRNLQDALRRRFREFRMLSRDILEENGEHISVSSWLEDLNK